MVLVAPHPSPTLPQRAAHPGDSTRQPGQEPSPQCGQQPGQAVLARLRDRSGGRPSFDPGLAGGLRAWLEDSAWELVSRRGEEAAPLFLGPRVLFGTTPSSPAHRADPAHSADPVGAGGAVRQELVLPTLVRTLLRQLVITGRIGEPLDEALDALRVDPRRADLVSRIEAMGERARDELADTLRTHTGHLSRLTPRFAAGWLPRTDDRVAIPLAGGRIVLGGVFDLLVGVPEPREATLCALGLATGNRSAPARTSLHYLALLETLRRGVPPFRLALINTALGRYGVEDVLEEHLRAVVAQVALVLSQRSANDG
jgi:hypothetical protein